MAAGLADAVLDSPDALGQRVQSLGTDAQALAALRQQLGAALSSAPLFQPVARVREWEWAWAEMVRRHQAGLAPAAFDVPDQSLAGSSTVALSP